MNVTLTHYVCMMTSEFSPELNDESSLQSPALTYMDCHIWAMYEKNRRQRDDEE